MKTVKKILGTSLVFLITAASFQAVTYAQQSSKNDQAGKDASIENLVKEKDFVFVAQSVMPLRGSVRQLTSVYDLRVLKDTIVSNLPYFGRAFSAPIDPSDGGINFTSTKFEYTAKDLRKGGWEIVIKPGDVRDVKQLFLDISENGSASLRVISLNREAISFNGVVREAGIDK